MHLREFPGRLQFSDGGEKVLQNSKLKADFYRPAGPLSKDL